jgi:acetolactate synthase I/II/III large subunit
MGTWYDVHMARATRTGASLLVDCLEAHGVRYVFGVPGASILPILDVLKDRGPEFVVCRHEQNAAFMAQAWGRMTGVPGVCLATVGPGATNLVTGVATATADRDSLVAITGQVPQAERAHTRHQQIRSDQLFAPITKWTTEVGHADTVATAMAQAFRVATEPRPGATHVAVPLDVLQMPTQASPIVRPNVPAGSADGESVATAAQLLASAKRPVVLLGVGASDLRSTRAVRTFLMHTGIPVVGTFEAAGVVGRKLVPQFLGRVGLSAEEFGDLALRKADVVLAIGYDAVEYAPSYWATKAAVIHVDRLPAEVDEAYAPRVELVGDIADALNQLAGALGEVHWQLTSSEVRLQQALVAEQARGAKKSGAPMHPARIIAELRKALRDEDILISDVGSHQVWIAREFFAYQPHTLLFSMGFQTMGVGLPWAMAARMVESRRRIVSCSGDGSFLMSVMELETAVRRKLPFVHLVWRDETYNLVEIQQMASYGRVTGARFGNPDIVKLAQSFGATGLRVTRPEQLAPTLARAFKIRGPVIIDVPVDYRHNAGLLGHGDLFGQ